MNALARFAAGGLAAMLCAGAAQAAELTVCLEENSAPYSYKFKQRQGGFDLALAEAVAAKLGRTLRIQWFETEQDEDEVLVWSLYALLADRRCDLLAGYALIGGNLGKPGASEYKLPDYDGKTKADRKRRVALEPLVASDPYLRTELAVVLAPTAAATPVRSLSDLKGKRIGVEVTTLAATLLHAHRGGALIEDVSTVAPNRDLLARVASGGFDAALIELHKAERHNQRNPDAKVTITGYRHEVGLNLAYAGLESAGALVRDVNAALQALAADGTLDKLAADAGISYVKPKPPLVLLRLSPAMMFGG